QLALLGVQDELHQRERRDGARVVRVDDVEQRFAELGEVVVDAQVYARGQEREALEQPLDVRVVALVGLELEPRRHLRVAAPELRARPPQEGQLALVVVEQVVDRKSTRLNSSHVKISYAV